MKRRHLAALLAVSVASGQLAAARAGTPDGTLVISSGADVSTVNTIDLWSTIPDRSIVDHISDTLLRLDASGKILPDLATGWKAVDALTWELTLRQGVTFQDGEPFTAAAVKAFYDTISDPRTRSPAAGIQNYADHVEIVDDYTVRVVTKKPFPAMPGTLTLVHAVPPEYLKRVGIDGFRAKPIGTGAYRFVEHVADDHVLLEANPDYWGGPQHYQKIVLRPIQEAAARVAALAAGETDLALDVPPELIPLVKSSGAGKIETVAGARTCFLIMNAINPKLATANPLVREAISYAIGRQDLADAVFDGLAAPAAWLNPGTFGYDPGNKPIVRDVAKARALLLQAGYPNGLDIKLDAPNGRYLKDGELAQAIAGQLAEAGIRTEVRSFEAGILLKQVAGKNTDEMVMLAQGDAIGDPDTFLRTTLLTGALSSLVADPKLDQLVNASSGEMDPDKRRRDLHAVQDYESHSFPIAYIVRLPIIVAVSDKLAGWQLRPDDKYLFYTNKVVGPD